MLTRNKYNYEKVFNTMVEETAKYLKCFGLKTMILGISGGLDSTVCAAICHEVTARYPEFRFIGISLPCNTNTKEENDSAELTLKAFCNEHHTINLQEQYSSMKNLCETLFNSTEISQGNIKARLRMIYLYNIASVTNGLVIDTDNLTEHYLGFFTLHGDQGDFNPIGGLWKHEVYELCKYLYISYYNSASKEYNALKAAYNITPTDGNGVVDGGDMAQIAPGHTYFDVDDILDTYLEYRGKNTEEYTITMNKLYERYGSETVNMVINRCNKSEFKRKCLPIVIDKKLYV